MMTAVISVIDSEIKENWQTKYQNILYQKIERFRQHVPYVNPEIWQNPNTDTDYRFIEQGHGWAPAKILLIFGGEKKKAKIPQNNSKSLDQLKQNIKKE